MVQTAISSIPVIEISEIRLLSHQSFTIGVFLSIQYWLDNNFSMILNLGHIRLMGVPNMRAKTSHLNKASSFSNSLLLLDLMPIWVPTLSKIFISNHQSSLPWVKRPFIHACSSYIESFILNLLSWLTWLAYITPSIYLSCKIHSLIKRIITNW